MKLFNKSIGALLLAFSILVVSCKKDPDPIPPAPTVSPAADASGIPGAKVQIRATISAPGGLKNITVLKNGAAFDSKTFVGETSAEYTNEYTIEQLPANSVVNFTMIATDNNNLSSSIATFKVTVGAIPAKQIVDVSGILSGNITWTADKIYRLKGFVRVGEDDFDNIKQTGVLTIEPGTVIIGERATKGTLVVQRGSRIVANGTAARPIVFTSERNPGEREAGDWGGLVICGRAANNFINNRTARQLEGEYGGFHGGTDDADNSGVLRYVRVEYAGVPVNPNQEINTFTFGSVGSGTVMEYLQASFGLDDSYEWFGGTANAKWLVAYRGLDDDFDVDNGFRGNVQYFIGIRGASQADQSGSNGFEVDNDGAGSGNTPFTSATFANGSIIGPKGVREASISPQFQNGAHLRRNCRIKIYNTVITGYPNGFYIDSQRGDTRGNAERGDLVLKNVVVAGTTGWGNNGFGGGTTDNPRGFPVLNNDISITGSPAISIGSQTPQAWFSAIAGNRILASTEGLGLSSSLFTGGRPTLTLAAGSSLVGTDLPSNLGAFFTANNVVGAFNTTDWTAGWAEFAPQTVNYR
jgi:hypothetical protein